MKRFTVLLIGFVLVTGTNADTFKNPIWPQNWPDPTAVFNPTDSIFYCLATGWNTTLLRSKDLVHWEDTGKRPYAHGAIKKMRQLGQSLWAPQFAKIGNKYMLYVTIRSSDKDAKIVALSSDSVTGPFRFCSVVTDGLDTKIIDTIDPFVFTDKTTHKVWLIYGSTGRIHIVELNKEGTAFAQGATPKPVAGRHINEDESRLTVYEGSYIYQRNGWWYLFCSPGRYNDYSYAIAVGRSRNPEGPYLDKEGNNLADGNATIILSSSPYDPFYGPGHNGEIFTDKSENTYMIYHVHNDNYIQSRKTNKYIPRSMNLQQIYWDAEGWPYFKAEEKAGGITPQF